jgi:hypothetical protein
MPYDVLTENMVGCGTAMKDGISVIWFDVGNFETPWHAGEEIILIIETYIDGKAYFAVCDLTLDATVDVQNVAHLTLNPIPEPRLSDNNAHWISLENENIIGYSLYATDKRLNKTIINNTTYPTDQEVFLRPVLRGGFETVYSSQGCQNTRTGATPLAYAFSVSPNPFSKLTTISFEVGSSQKSVVSIEIYDITGRLVKSFGTLPYAPCPMQISWDATDDQERAVSSGVYFVRFKTVEKLMQEKVLLIR